jgi:Rho GTPase-activating protein RGD1
LKECADEVDLGTQYHLARYAFLFESAMLSDGSALSPTNTDEGQSMSLFFPDGDLTPRSGPSLKSIIESIDNRGDFKVYMQNYAYAHGGQVRGPRREGPQDEGFVRSRISRKCFLIDLPFQLPPLPSHAERIHHAPTNGADRGRPTFGVDLNEQMTRDDVEVPPIVVKCCTAIEKYGIHSVGIYRIGGTVTKINKLKEKLDRGQ